jgi:hypothetical protein
MPLAPHPTPHTRRYDGGYHAEHRVVQWLWEVVTQDLDPDERRLFLKFFTGSDRSPIGGLGNLRCVIQVSRAGVTERGTMGWATCSSQATCKRAWSVLL